MGVGGAGVGVPLVASGVVAAGGGVGVTVSVGVGDGVTKSGVLVGTIWSENSGGSVGRAMRVASSGPATALGKVLLAK